MWVFFFFLLVYSQQRSSLFIDSVSVSRWAEELLPHPSRWHLHWSSHTSSVCPSDLENDPPPSARRRRRRSYAFSTFFISSSFPVTASASSRTRGRVSFVRKGGREGDSGRVRGGLIPVVRRERQVLILTVDGKHLHTSAKIWIKLWLRVKSFYFSVETLIIILKVGVNRGEN